MAFKPQTVLLIPDVHAMPGDDLDRLRALRNWLNERRVLIDKIVQIGDLWDMKSLCLHDKESPEWYQRNVKDDIDAGFEALAIIQEIADDWELTNKEIIITGGNHEDRYDKWMKSDNRLLTSDFPKTMKSLINVRAPGVKYVPFLTPTFICGAAFSHYFVSGVMNRPHSGERPALSMLRTHHQTVIAGHKHTLDLAEHTKPDGSKIYGFICGSFVNPNGDFSYAGAGRKLWWTGVHLLHFTAPGEIDVESVSLARM